MVVGVGGVGGEADLGSAGDLIGGGVERTC